VLVSVEGGGIVYVDVRRRCLGRRRHQNALALAAMSVDAVVLRVSANVKYV